MGNETDNVLRLAKSLSEIRTKLGSRQPKASDLYPFRPKIEWLLREKLVSGIHGIMHMARVLILQEVLTELLITEGMNLDRIALRWAAITHDVRRINDEIDESHGQRSAEWVKKNLRDVIPDSSLSKVVYINEWHAHSRKSTPKNLPELFVLKEADSLDRIRLGKQYFNPRYLHYPVSKFLILPAEVLYKESTYNIKQGTDLFTGVIEAAIKLGIIIGR